MWRPDLLKDAVLDKKEMKFLRELQEKQKASGAAEETAGSEEK